MKKVILTAVLSLSALLLAAARLDMMPTEFRTYKVGETVTFTATAWEKADKKLSAGICKVTIKENGGKVLKTIELDFAKNNPASFSAKLDRPGFIFAEAGALKLADNKNIKWAVRPLTPNGGAAVEPEKIKAVTVEPKDFDQFWAKGLEEYKNAEIIVTPAPEIKRKGYKVSRVLVKFPDNSGAIDGFLSIPAQSGKYPALVGVPGAGAGRTDPIPYIAGNVKAIQLWMNVHTFRTEKNMKLQRKRYAEYRKSFKTQNYFLENAGTPDKYIYRNIWLAVSRAADYVAKLPEFNGKQMIAAGNSQGGGTALVMAYLNKNITCAIATVPALSDHDGWKEGRQAGWPQLHKALKGKADKAYAYFDTAVFASKIKVPTFIAVGFVDTTCSPSSVYAAYNAIPGEKTIYHMYRNSHSLSDKARLRAEHFANAHIARGVHLDIRTAEERIYKVNEEIKFTAAAYSWNKKLLKSGKYTLSVFADGNNPVSKPVTIDLAKDNPYTFTVKLDKPGFIYVKASPITLPDKKVITFNRRIFTAQGGAAVEPEKIRAGGERPADFDKFWQDGLEEFKKAEVIVTEDKSLKVPGSKISRIMVKFPDNSGAIDGFLSIPAKPGKYPIIAGVPGAGSGSLTPSPNFMPSKPAIIVWMNVHNFRTANTTAEQKKRYAAYNNTFKDKKIYCMANADDRDKYIFRRVWLAVSRAIDYAVTLKEFDGKNLAAVGSSQGGGTAFALTYLNKNVTCMVSNVPALCDHSGWKVQRQAGWPQLHLNLAGKADKAAPYFDAANFAAKIKVPSLVSAGFVDVTCSPSSVYAAYNNLAGSKEMFNMPTLGHVIPPDFQEKATEFLDRHLVK